MAEQPRHREPSHAEQASRPDTPTSRPYDVREEPQVHGPSGGASQRHNDAGRRHDDPATAEEPGGWRNIGRRISWGAIFAGVVVALAIQLLLSVLGIGIGAAAVDPTAPGDPTAWTIGAGVWWVITGLIALFIGGWVAGHLATNPDRRDGALHGVVTWGLATLIGVWLLTTTIGTVTAGAWQVVATGMEANGQIVEQLQQPAGVEEPRQPQQQDQDALQDPQQLAEQADEALAHAGIWTFIAMVLGAAAAAVGGFLATPRNEPYNIQQR